MEDFGTYGGLKYKLTEDEWGWMKFVRGRYSIADYIDSNTEDGITTFDAIEFSVALDDDWNGGGKAVMLSACGGCGKAVMLSDDTALQAIFFCGYDEEAYKSYSQ